MSTALLQKKNKTALTANIEGDIAVKVFELPDIFKEVLCKGSKMC